MIEVVGTRGNLIGWRDDSRDSLRRSADLRGGCFLRLLTVGTHTEYAMAVVKRFEPVAAGNLILQTLDLFAVKLDQFAAGCAYQMIVMRVLVMMFIQHPAIVEFQLACKSALFQQLQRAIHGSESNCRVLGFDD